MVACREELKTARLFKQANFPTRRTLETYEWHDQILLPSPRTKEALISLFFIRQKENAVFIGAPGTGKAHLASALGQVATKEGIETRFWLVSDLVIELEYQWKNNSLEHFKTSNLEFSQWNKVFSDPRLTAAFVDRLIHHAHILSFTGESYRLKNSLSKSK